LYRFMVGQYVTIHDNVISHINITNARDEDGGLYSCEGIGLDVPSWFAENKRIIYIFYLYVAKNAMGVVSHKARLNIYGNLAYFITLTLRFVVLLIKCCNEKY
jgi:hypothetical protein